MSKSIELEIYESFQRNPNLPRDDLYDIINKVVKINFHFEDGQEFVPLTKLNIEIAMGNRDEVGKLLSNGADVNEINYDGVTPLAEAVLVDDFFMAQFLLDHGADVNGNEKFNPLIIAADQRNARMIGLLRRYGVDPNKLDSEGFNALHHVFNNGMIPGLKALTCNYFYFAKFLCDRERIQNEFCATDIICCIQNLAMAGIDLNYANEINLSTSGTSLIVPVSPLSLALEGMPLVVVDYLIKLGVERKAYELAPWFIYQYQDSINSFDDIKEINISLLSNVPFEYARYLDYKRRIKKYQIEVCSNGVDDGYKRPKMIRMKADF